MKIDVDSDHREFARLIGGTEPQGKMMRAQLIHAGYYNLDTSEVPAAAWEACKVKALAETANDERPQPARVD